MNVILRVLERREHAGMTGSAEAPMTVPAGSSRSLLPIFTHVREFRAFLRQYHGDVMGHGVDGGLGRHDIEVIGVALSQLLYERPSLLRVLLSPLPYSLRSVVIPVPSGQTSVGGFIRDLENNDADGVEAQMLDDAEEIAELIQSAGIAIEQDGVLFHHRQIPHYRVRGSRRNPRS